MGKIKERRKERPGKDEKRNNRPKIKQERKNENRNK